jgi:hypothetical protein
MQQMTPDVRASILPRAKKQRCGLYLQAHDPGEGRKVSENSREIHASRARALPDPNLRSDWEGLVRSAWSTTPSLCLNTIRDDLPARLQMLRRFLMAETDAAVAGWDVERNAL